MIFFNEVKRRGSSAAWERIFFVSSKEIGSLESFELITTRFSAPSNSRMFVLIESAMCQSASSGTAIPFKPTLFFMKNIKKKKKKTPLPFFFFPPPQKKTQHQKLKEDRPSGICLLVGPWI